MFNEIVGYLFVPACQLQHSTFQKLSISNFWVNVRHLFSRLHSISQKSLYDLAWPWDCLVMFHCLFSHFGPCGHSAQCPVPALPGQSSLCLFPLTSVGPGHRTPDPGWACAQGEGSPLHGVFQDGQSCSSSGPGVSGYPGFGINMVTRFGLASPGPAVRCHYRLLFSC